MSKQKNNQPAASNANKTSFMHQLLGRVHKALEQAEQHTADSIQHEIEQAIALEAAVEDMTKEEIDLIGAYLKRDLKHLSHFVSSTGKGLAEWLSFDLHLIEGKLLKSLLSIADKTVLEQEEFKQSLAENKEVYMAGEQVLPGSFCCQLCGEPIQITAPSILEKCIACGRVDFQRTSCP